MPAPRGRHPRQDYWTVTVKVSGDESDPDVPVTVTVYIPAGVPPPGGGVVVLLPLLLQAVMKMKPAIITQTSRIPSSIFRRELKPAPSNVIPPIGSNRA